MFKVHGAERLGAAIERCIGLAEHAQQLVEPDPAWTVVSPAQLGIVTFTRSGWTAQDHAAQAAAVAAAGHATVTSTILQGRPALRLCTINPRTTEADIALTLAYLADA